MSNIKLYTGGEQPVKIETANKNLSINTTVIGGARGKSAYEIWLEEGNVGTVQDFLAALDKHHTHNQTIPNDIWTIQHNLNKYASVTIVDSSDTIVYGEVEYLTKNTVKITFSAEFSGRAYLN